MVFAAGCVFSSVSKHGPHKSCTLSLNKSLTVREKPGSCGHFPKPWRSFSRPLAGTFRLLSGPEFSCSSRRLQLLHRRRTDRLLYVLPYFSFFGGVRSSLLATCVTGKLDAQPVSPVAFTQARKSNTNGNETWAEK